MTSNPGLFEHKVTTDQSDAHLLVDARARASHKVNPRLLGKFCEHLGANIYHGISAQIAHNPTLAKWRFSAGDNHPDGGVREESDFERITERIVAFAERQGWPDPARVVDAYFGGCAYGWFGIGDTGDVRLSPDVGPHGGRAQRVEVLHASEAERHGIGQWTYLPLHRTRTYEVRVVARAATPCTVELRLGPPDRPELQATARIELDGAWQSQSGTLVLPAETATVACQSAAAADLLYELSLTASEPAHILLDRVLLYPDDAIEGADPDVIRMLREAHLPLLRWPGGNFVSGYHWRDGVGPLDERPTLPNPAWEGLEFNLFGTDEFIAFCRAVGCEPMICVNAGNGTPEEAAAWVEYCNGGPATPMGRLRAANGHPDPYDVRLWEIGNELYGHWQVGWTTPEGNVDRYHRFREAMLAADPTLDLIGCGYGNEPDSEWNRRLIEGAAQSLQTITDHILTGGSVGAETDPVELVHAFMGYPTVLEARYRDLEQGMRRAGIEKPQLAITELQLFAHFYGAWSPDDALTPAKMPRPDTITEALFLTQIIATCVRLGDFVTLLTHSATVNHGGGLRKERERVYANPVHHAHALGHALAGGTPVAVQLASATFSTHRDFAHIPPMDGVPLIDALAVLSETGDLILSLVHRGAAGGPIDLEIALEGYRAQPQAEVITLAGETWYDRNTREAPERISPQSAHTHLDSDDHLRLTLAPFSVTQITLRERPRRVGTA